MAVFEPAVQGRRPSIVSRRRPNVSGTSRLGPGSRSAESAFGNRHGSMLLVDAEELSDKSVKDAARILNSANRMNQMIADLLAAR